MFQKTKDHSQYRARSCPYLPLRHVSLLLNVHLQLMAECVFFCVFSLFFRCSWVSSLLSHFAIFPQYENQSQSRQQSTKHEIRVIDWIRAQKTEQDVAVRVKQETWSACAVEMG